jgi:hypothetical protein
MNKVMVKGIGVELDGCRDVLVSNNIITITPNGTYGVRIIPSGTKKNVFDCSDVSIFGNTIINKSTHATVGIEIFNDRLDVFPKYIKIADNIIKNETTSDFTGISVYNVNKVILENNIIKSNGTLLQGIMLNAFVKDSIFSADIIGNDISGAKLAGIQCGDTTVVASQKINLINNRVYNNTTNLGLGTGWEFFTANNYAPSPNYYTPKAIHGDLRYYTSPPANGTWLLNEIVYNATPGSGLYLGWVCISAGSPGIWKGFGLIEN